jgi:hypothetical protein
MALVYFVDGALAPTSTGDAFATEARLTKLLNYHPKWAILTVAEREEKIKEATAQLDTLDYRGTLVSPTQPLQFPRVMTSDTTGEFTVAEQVRRLFRAVAAQVEYNLSRVGIGMTSYSHSGESFAHRQDIICREAQMTLGIYER